MPNFICQNKECSNFGKKEYYPNVRFTWNEKLMRLEASESICPVCGEFRETERENKNFEGITFIDPNTANYDNKKVKKYDYDRSIDKSETIKI